jgi:hypothetical protein
VGVIIEKRWYCYHCGFNCKIEFWESKIGERYICECGVYGLMTDFDAPKQIIDDQGDNESCYDFRARIYGEE